MDQGLKNQYPLTSGGPASSSGAQDPDLLGKFLDLDRVGYRFSFNRIRNRTIQMK